MQSKRVMVIYHSYKYVHNTITYTLAQQHVQSNEWKSRQWVHQDTQPVAEVLEYLHAALIIIIIIKKGRQFKAEREWYTPYQSEDPSPIIPTYRQKEEKGKKSRRL